MMVCMRLDLSTYLLAPSQLPQLAEVPKNTVTCHTSSAQTVGSTPQNGLGCYYCQVCAPQSGELISLYSTLQRLRNTEMHLCFHTMLVVQSRRFTVRNEAKPAIRFELTATPLRFALQRSRSMRAHLSFAEPPQSIVFRALQQRTTPALPRQSRVSLTTVNGKTEVSLTVSVKTITVTIQRVHAVSRQSGELARTCRRDFLCRTSALLLLQLVSQHAQPATADVQVPPASIRLDLAPKQGTFDPTDERLRDAAALLQRALNAEEVQVQTQTIQC